MSAPERRMSVSDRMKMLKQSQDNANTSTRAKNVAVPSTGGAASRYTNATQKKPSFDGVAGRIGSVKNKFQTLMDYELAHKLQEEEYGNIKNRNTMHSGHRKVDVKVARKEETVEQEIYQEHLNEQLEIEGLDRNVSMDIHTKEQKERLAQLSQAREQELRDMEIASQHNAVEADKARMILEERRQMAKDEAIAAKLQNEELDHRRKQLSSKTKQQSVAKLDEAYASTLVKLESQNAQKRMQAQNAASASITEGVDEGFLRQQEQELRKLKQKASGRMEEEEEDESDDENLGLPQGAPKLTAEFIKQQRLAMERLQQQQRQQRQEEEGSGSDESEFDI